MLESQKLRIKASEIRSELNELNAKDVLSEEDRTAMTAASASLSETELRYRTAIQLEDKPVEVESRDGEDLELVEMRDNASLSRYFQAASRGSTVDGVEAELSAHFRANGNIPLAMFEKRAVTPIGATVGVNLDVLRPQVFSGSVASELSIDMPQVESGTYASGTITTSATAGAAAKEADVPETAGAFTLSTTTPHRIGGSMNLAIEDIAAAGQANFDSLLREHISIVLSSELDNQILNGAGASNDLTGFFARLDAATAAGAAISKFDDFVAAFANGIDGLWSNTIKEVGIIVGVDTYKIAAKAFRDNTTDLGDTSFADYAMANTAGFSTNARMPAAASNLQNGILCRKGRSMMPAPMRTAVCPHWGSVSIDDVYSGARAGTRRFVVSVLVGDVIIVQPGSYQQVQFRTAV